ncbi:MAG: hypothetical protein QOD10_1589, partial [Mycobacterium sp.]|nr:hypothetical protein [Mycobacterium sp.]
MLLRGLPPWRRRYLTTTKPTRAATNHRGPSPSH